MKPTTKLTIRNRTISAALLTVSAACFIGNAPLHAQFCNPEEVAKIFASDGAAGDSLGSAVDFSGAVAIVGAPHDDDLGTSSGSAYIFRFDGTNWLEESKLLPADLKSTDRFGASVAIDGNIAIIGAYLADDLGSAAGAAYIFRFDGKQWLEEAKLLASDGIPLALFGYSVDISGNQAVVGAYSQDGNAQISGAAYVFRFDGSEWLEEQKLIGSETQFFSAFGIDVSIDGTRILIGAASEQDEYLAGEAYIFDHDGTEWVESAILRPHDGAVEDYFGVSVSLAGNRALIGRLYETVGTRGFGAAYIFRDDGIAWVEEQKIASPETDKFTYFGQAVALTNDTALIGAWSADGNETGSGAAYLYARHGSEWLPETTLFAAQGYENSYFGVAVAADTQQVFIGCAHDDEGIFDSGSASFFDLNCLARLDILPEPLIAGTPPLFLASALTPEQPTYLVYSTTGLGETIIPFLNITLDIENPKQAGPTRTADEWGRAQWVLPIPQNALGWNLWFQTAQFENKTRTVSTYVVR